MKCNKPYTVTSTNPRMGGSVKPKSYMGGGLVKSYKKGGMIKSYQEGGLVEDKPTPSKLPKEEQQRIAAQMARKEAAEREAAAVQRVEDEKMREQTQKAYEKATGIRLPRR